MDYLIFKKYFVVLILVTTYSCSSKSWRDASRESAGIAPHPKQHSEAIYQIYYARAWSWRGVFGIHPWISWKRKNESTYTVAQVTSWALRRGTSAIIIKNDLPDRLWFGNKPTLMFQIVGGSATKVINKTEKLIKRYPLPDIYRVWPGPNSNTFVEYIIRNIDEINVELPPHAVGKDWPSDYNFLSRTSSGTGYTISFWGILGLSLGLDEGIEVNILGANFGIDFYPPALKLPMLGRLGFEETNINY